MFKAKTVILIATSTNACLKDDLVLRYTYINGSAHYKKRIKLYYCYELYFNNENDYILWKLKHNK